MADPANFGLQKINSIFLLENEVDQLLLSNKYVIENSDSDSVSVKTFNARENLMTVLSDLIHRLSGISTKLSSALDKTRITHNQEIVVVDSLMRKVNRKNTIPEPHEDTAWTKVVRGRNRSKKIDDNTNAIPPVDSKKDHMMALIPSKVGATDEKNPKYTRVKFTEALSLPAIKIHSFDQVKDDGELYYIDSADHFAIKIAGQLFHGNIGTVYTEEKNPSKIKDCKFAESCVKQDKCDYYHNPMKFIGSKDRRNFIASSFLYSPPGIGGQYKSLPRGRQFGSRSHLDVDIVDMGDEERQKFHDQTMHDILCSLLLMKSYVDQ